MLPRRFDPVPGTVPVRPGAARPDEVGPDEVGPDEVRSVRRPVTALRVTTLADGRTLERPDRVVTEEPMEIRLQAPGEMAEPLAVTMRTPGNDFELAVGFCTTEGILPGLADLEEVAYCIGDGGVQQYNVVTLRTRRSVDVGSARRFVSSASCGICGKTALDDVEVATRPVAPGPVVARSVLAGLPETLRASQQVFDETGGLHAAALFDTDGTLLILREDVGRHNAVDKVIGHEVLADRLPLHDRVLLVSGRISFEIVQKAAVAGIPVLCAVSAPSSLAVDAAKRLHQTLVGFLRDDRCNVYAGVERVDADS